MKIHTFSHGDTVENIAKKHGISVEGLLSSNIKGSDAPAIGEELLVLTPTRTYVLKQGDSPERLALRFGVRKIDLLAQNPWIATEGMVTGRTVNLKYDDRVYGTAPTNGYFYSGCDVKVLKTALPYLTYVTVAAAVADENSVKFIFNTKEILKCLYEENKIPLLRIYDKSKKRNLDSEEERAKYIKNIIDVTLSEGYEGVVLSAEKAGGDYRNFGEFLVELRKAMIGCELILILEVDEKVPADICELADGNILFYPKFATSPDLSFEKGEEKVYSEFATKAESAKTFIDISSLASLGDNFITLEEAAKLARSNGYTITTNSESLISNFQDKNRGRCTFSSLGNIKRTYKLIDDYGFMGASFDIGRTPISHLLMYNALFKTAAHTNVRSPEGCAKGG